MKYKEIKKILALTMALSLAAPANVFAADIQTQADGNQVVEEPETPQCLKTPQEPEQPEGRYRKHLSSTSREQAISCRKDIIMYWLQMAICNI